MQPVRVPGKWKEHLKLHDFVRIDGAEYRIAQSMAAAAKKDAKRPGSASSVGSESINTSVRGDIFCTNAIIYCVANMACLSRSGCGWKQELQASAGRSGQQRRLRWWAAPPKAGEVGQNRRCVHYSRMRKLFLIIIKILFNF